MDFDFAAFLVLATFLTGGVWAVDAIWFASKRAAAVSGVEGGGKEPLLVEYSRSFFPVILIVLLLRSFIVEPFKIPSGSMMPTLLAGDFILVNKFAYGIRLPVINTKVVPVDTPDRGDVAVFRFPRNPEIDYIKRVVGLPGDRISYREKQLYINGNPIVYKPAGYYSGVGTSASMNGAAVREERLGEVNHQILVREEIPNYLYPCLARGEYIVPEGHYFVLGDNRDNSNDSRFWCAVPEKNLVGKAFFIWMSWDFGKSGIAWNRIGNNII